MLCMPDWKEIHVARSFSDLQAPYSAPFVAMAQAHLPNPNKPPFYADFIVEQKDGELAPNHDTIKRLFETFCLAGLVPVYAGNLKQLGGRLRLHELQRPAIRLAGHSVMPHFQVKPIRGPVMQ